MQRVRRLGGGIFQLCLKMQSDILQSLNNYRSLNQKCPHFFITTRAPPVANLHLSRSARMLIIHGACAALLAFTSPLHSRSHYNVHFVRDRHHSQRCASKMYLPVPASMLSTTAAASFVVMEPVGAAAATRFDAGDAAVAALLLSVILLSSVRQRGDNDEDAVKSVPQERVTGSVYPTSMQVMTRTRETERDVNKRA